MKNAFTLRLILLVILSLGVLTVAQVTLAQDDDDPVATEEVEDDTADAEEADDEDAAETDDADAESEADDEETDDEADEEVDEADDADAEAEADDEGDGDDADTGELGLIFAGVLFVILVLGIFAFGLLRRQRN